MPHFDSTINIGTIIHLAGLILALITFYVKLMTRQARIETLFEDIVRRLALVEETLIGHSTALQRLIGRTDAMDLLTRMENRQK